MTVNTVNITSGPYTGNGLSDTYSYTFRIETASQISVYEFDDLGNPSTLLTEGVDFSVTGLGVDGGGTVVRTAGNLPTDYTWYIRSNYIETQLTDFNSQGAFFPEVHEAALDKLTFLYQQQLDGLSRAMRFADDYTGSLDPLLPTPATGYYLKWAADGSLTNDVGTGGGGGGSFVPLAGTTPGAPLIGDLDFDVAGVPGLYRISHATAFTGSNSINILSDDDDSGVLLQARDTTGNGGTAWNYYFSPDGGLQLPSSTAGDYFDIGTELVLGAETLVMRPTLAAGGVAYKGLQIHTNTLYSFLFHRDGELVLARQTAPGDDDLVAATKKYVDDAIPVGGGEINTNSDAGVGAGLTLTKVVNDLPLRTLTSLSAHLTIVENGNEIDFDFDDTPTFTSVGWSTGAIGDSLVLSTTLAVTGLSTLGAVGWTGGATGDTLTLSSTLGVTGLTSLANVGWTAGAIGDSLALSTTLGVTGHSALSSVGWSAGAVGDDLALSGILGITGEPTTDFVTSTGDVDTLTRKDYVDSQINTHTHSGYVSTTASETIAGTKTFSSKPTFSAGATVGGSLTATIITASSGSTFSSTLAVNGKLTVSNDVVVNGASRTLTVGSLSAGGDLEAAGLGTIQIKVSDERMKEDINDLGYGLNQILQLHPVSHFWKDKARGYGRRLSFIAQNASKIIPEAFPYDEKSDTWTYKSGEIIPVLVKAIQQMSDEKCLLESRFDEVLGRLTEMEAKIKS